MRRNNLLGIAALVWSISACSPEVIESEQPDIDAYLRGLPYLPVEAEVVQSGDPSAPVNDGDYQCITENLLETRQFDKIVAYAANSESLWPGALVNGDSVYTGLFTPAPLPRQPVTFSVSLENLDGAKSAEMRDPSLSTYREALTEILDAELTGAAPANIYSEIEQVHSEEQLSLALGVDVSWGLGTASVESSFDFSEVNTRSRFLVKFTQAYYTVDVDAPDKPTDWIAPFVTMEEVQARFNPANPPLYVSSVTYGRMVVFTFESSYSSEEMNAALSFAYRGGADVSGDVSVTYKEVIENSKITAYILGGSSGAAAESIDSYEALLAFIRDGGEYNRQSPGAPIAYKLAHLQDNSPARMSFTSDYEVTECARVSQRVRVVLKSIQVDSAGGDAGDDLELFGRVWAESSTGGEIELLNKTDDTYVTIREGELFPGGLQIAEGILSVAPEAGNVVRLRANLTDYDPLSSNDSMGNETIELSFEAGWRREVTVNLTGDDAHVKLNFSLAPI